MRATKFLDPKNDFAFKKIFGTEKNKDILIHFLNDILGFSAEEKRQVAKKLHTQGIDLRIDLQTIALATGLSKEELEHFL